MESRRMIASTRFYRRACGSALALLMASATVVVADGGVGASAHPAASKGPVDVIAAGSLETILAKLAPSFAKETGYSLVPTTNGAFADASEIKGETVKEDVFISAGPAPVQDLEGAKNGDWASWYAQIGTTPLLVGYNPRSKFAHDLRTMPWYKVVVMKGFLLGRTDPATDPKGVLAVAALDDAAAKYHEPALKTLGTESSNVYTEDSLVGRLQAGQLDAGFFYGVEATAATPPLKTITLAPLKLSATYDLVILNRAPHEAGAVAFTSWLLGPKAKAILTAEGFTLDKPAKLTGNKSAVPRALHSVIS